MTHDEQVALAKEIGSALRGDAPTAPVERPAALPANPTAAQAAKHSADNAAYAQALVNRRGMLTPEEQQFLAQGIQDWVKEGRP
jgi:hypothetical protein